VAVELGALDEPDVGEPVGEEDGGVLDRDVDTEVAAPGLNDYNQSGSLISRVPINLHALRVIIVLFRADRTRDAGGCTSCKST
jgi:hypothetical protein